MPFTKVWAREIRFLAHQTTRRDLCKRWADWTNRLLDPMQICAIRFVKAGQVVAGVIFKYNT